MNGYFSNVYVTHNSPEWFVNNNFTKRHLHRVHSLHQVILNLATDELQAVTYIFFYVVLYIAITVHTNVYTHTYSSLLSEAFNLKSKLFWMILGHLQFFLGSIWQFNRFWVDSTKGSWIISEHTLLHVWNLLTKENNIRRSSF